VRLALACAALSLCACDQIGQSEKTKYDRPDLIGAYQMIAVRSDKDGLEQAVVLDTRTGNISTCKPAPVKMECTMGTQAFP